MVSSSVVLPEPFGPTSARCSSRSSANDTSSSRRFSPADSARAVGLDDRAAAPGRLEEVEAERAVAAGQALELGGRLAALALQPADVRELRLGLLRLRLLVAEPRHEALEPLDVGVEPADRLLGLLRPGGLLQAPLRPGPGEVQRPAAAELEHGVRDRFEEPAVVRDEDDGGVERLELALEPLDALDVEVVRRLVQEQQIRVAGERARQRGARQLAARERVERAVEVGLGEPKPADDARRALSPGVAAGVLEPRLRRRVAVERRGVVGACRHGAFELAQLLLERDQVGGAGEHVLAKGEARGRAAAAGRAARRGSPSRTRALRRRCRARRRACRSSVVLPAPFGPASDSRSRRSTLKDTPSKSVSPAMSFRRLFAITTAMARLLRRSRKSKGAAVFQRPRSNTSGGFGRGAYLLGSKPVARSATSPTLARRFPSQVSGTRPYPLVPPLPVLEDFTTGPPPFRGSRTVATTSGRRKAPTLDRGGP